MHRRTINRRIVSGIKRGVAKGRLYKPPLGWKWDDSTTAEGYRQVAADAEYRAQALEILRLSQNENLSDRQILARLQGVTNPSGKPWTLGALQRARRAAADGFPNNTPRRKRRETQQNPSQDAGSLRPASTDQSSPTDQIDA